MSPLQFFMLINMVGELFWSPTLWPQFWGPSSSPWGSPTSARPGTDFRACFIKNTLLGIIKLVIWNFFLTLPDIWVRFWSHPQPHGELQHQQGQEVILKYFIKDIFLGIVKLVILNFFVTPPDIWVSFWSHPQPHGELQNQQGQELILEPILIEKHYCLFPPRPFWPLSRLSPIQTLQFFMVINLACVIFLSRPWVQSYGPSPCGTPTSVRPWTDFRANVIKQELLQA